MNARLRREKLMQTNTLEEVKNNDIIINNMYNQISDIITNNTRTDLSYQCVISTLFYRINDIHSNQYLQRFQVCIQSNHISIF